MIQARLTTSLIALLASVKVAVSAPIEYDYGGNSESAFSLDPAEIGIARDYSDVRALGSWDIPYYNEEDENRLLLDEDLEEHDTREFEFTTDHVTEFDFNTRFETEEYHETSTFEFDHDVTRTFEHDAFETNYDYNYDDNRDFDRNREHDDNDVNALAICVVAGDIEAIILNLDDNDRRDMYRRLRDGYGYGRDDRDRFDNDRDDRDRFDNNRNEHDFDNDRFRNNEDHFTTDDRFNNEHFTTDFRFNEEHFTTDDRFDLNEDHSTTEELHFTDDRNLLAAHETTTSHFAEQTYY